MIYAFTDTPQIDEIPSWQDLEHDDMMDADDHDLRRAIKDGWISNWQAWDGR